MKIHLKFETLDNLIYHLSSPIWIIFQKKDSSCIPTNINKNQNSAILKLRRDWRDLKPGEELKFICDFGFRTYQNSTTEFFPQLMLNI